MGVPDGAHTHGHGGGSDLGTALLVLFVAALVVKAAAAVLGAAAELLHVFLIVAGVVVGTGAAGLVGLLIWRWRRSEAARAAGQLHGAAVPPLHGEARAAQPLPQPRPAIEQHVHHHWHGVSAKDVAAILRRQDQP
jgi:hypothetical protein